MEIQPGQRLLHYRLTEKIGEGGMGVVWKATDTSLERDVAIKILPEAFAGEAERLARFEREARLLASLNHPHIAGIHGIHEADGRHFLSMELVSGEDLSTVLQRGALPLERALQVAREIAEALEVAHESGVVHRDLKPANVRLTVDGKAKVLDFGLAKAHVPEITSDSTRLATVTSAGTMAGLILGTAAYMSPEQASGQPVDRRTDIWSFGVMLYEMLSNKRLFEGETISHTLADVLRAPIELQDLPANTPPAIRRLIERCLERDPMRRLRDIGEARIALEDTIADPHKEVPTAGVGVASIPTRTSLLPWLITGLAIVVAVVGFIRKPANELKTTEPTRRFTIEVPNSTNARQGDDKTVAISSDGLYVVTQGGTGAEDMLHRRAMNDFKTVPIEGTVGARNPLWSPDDKWIAFLRATELYKIRSSGGAAIKLGGSFAAPYGLHWGKDGYIYYGKDNRIWRISAEGGESEAVTERADDHGLRLSMPHLVPNTQILLCNSLPAESGQLFAFSLETRELKDLDMPGSDPRYLPTGHVMFAQGNRISVARFDIERLEFTGTPSTVLPRAWVDQTQMQLDVSQQGTVVYVPVAPEERQTLVSVDLDGQVTPLLDDDLPFITLNDLRISRDGHRLLLSVGGGPVWMLDLDTQTPTLMTESGFYPQWSPDDNEIIYGTSRNASFDIYRRPVDLSRPEELVLDVENNLRTADWTRQGKLIIREEIPDKGMDLRLLDGFGDATAMKPLLEGDDDELAPIVSYDGKWLAYVSDYSGSDEVYVTTFPEPSARLQISTKGGTSPTWAPDGSALYYFEGWALIAASIETEPRFRVTGRQKLFEGNFTQYRWSRQYDIHPDGKHFILVKNPPRGNVEVVTNFFAELGTLGN